MRVLLVTNDFPPKIGGIQVVQEQLFAALDPDGLFVLAAGHPDARAHDDAVPYRVERTSSSTLWPTPVSALRLDRLVSSDPPDVVVYGSALPLSLLHPVTDRHGVPSVSIVYGADVSVPARLPVAAQLQRHVLTRASGIVAMGPWVSRLVAAEVRRAGGSRPVPPTLVLYPGVDTSRFTPGDRQAARALFGLDPDRPTITSISRLVPRKGMHFLVEATKRLVAEFPDVQVVIGGIGREEQRLHRLVHDLGLREHVRLLGMVPEDRLAAFHRCGDVFAMLCHDRWAGLEAEGFGIVFVEAGACGVPVVAGRSGGATDAVEDGVTGLVVDGNDVGAVARALGGLLRDADRAVALGEAGRDRAVERFDWGLQRSRFVDWMQDRYRPE